MIVDKNQGKKGEVKGMLLGSVNNFKINLKKSGNIYNLEEAQFMIIF